MFVQGTRHLKDGPCAKMIEHVLARLLVDVGDCLWMFLFLCFFLAFCDCLLGVYVDYDRSLATRLPLFPTDRSELFAAIALCAPHVAGSSAPQRAQLR